jgi:hypothetical protein
MAAQTAPIEAGTFISHFALSGSGSSRKRTAFIPDEQGTRTGWRPAEGQIIAVGRGARDESGAMMPLDIKRGERILWASGENRSITRPPTVPSKLTLATALPNTSLIQAA